MSDGERQPHVRLPQLRLHYGMHGDLKRDGDDTDDASGSDNQRHTLSAAGASPGTVTQERKRSRYISDIDRSIIIQRLEKGEKQADLAREFGVTRAAICHINKHKEDVLTRFDEFARSPHGRVMIENYARPSTEFASVTEVRTAPAVVLTTRIMDKTTRPREFRAAADRLIKLLLEEALMSCGSTTVPTDSITSQGAEDLTMDSTPCAVALERDGNVMLNLFKQMEPEAATGSIRGSDSLRESPTNSGWQVLTVDLPDGIASASVMLLVPVFSSASLACAAIEELHARGVPPSSVCIVCVFCSFDAALSLSARQPDVSIITAVLSKQTNEPSEPLDDFSHRYFAPTTEGSDAL